uniref:Uncharacterized protein n=1 Tax=Triticum urartu TaxID=4572 RepID=A0A8R7TQY3_TRIUA
MGADEEEHQSPARKCEHEEGEEPVAADEKRPRTADESEGASLLGLANYAGEEEERGARGGTRTAGPGRRRRRKTMRVRRRTREGLRRGGPCRSSCAGIAPTSTPSID